MSQKAIREYDGKLMLSKYLNQNSGQTHTQTDHHTHRATRAGRESDH